MPTVSSYYTNMCTGTFTTLLLLNCTLFYW